MSDPKEILAAFRQHVSGGIMSDTPRELTLDQALEQLEAHYKDKMTDNEIAARFKGLVKNKGKNPTYHDATIMKLRKDWPLMYSLIKEVEND